MSIIKKQPDNMYTINTNPKCSVNITTNRNRVKTYDKGVTSVYLKDGQRFELEIFNPHKFKVLAKVKFNGHYISDSGLVLNPGQRIYLERYLDSNNAFLFSTYEIDGTTEALRAISENGNIEVEFYSAYIPSGISWTNFGGNTGYQYYHNTLIGDNTVFGGSSTITWTNDCSTFACSTANINASYEAPKGSLETGRVEKGNSTKQSFSESNDSFNTFTFEKVQLKLLPLSAKPVEVNEIRSYCTECGTRVKKATWKFCPSCGNKF